MAFDPMILPPINAALNGIAGTLLLIGYYLIRTKRWKAHRAVMIAAFSVSVLFLACYLTYHAMRGVNTPFGGVGPIRGVYFTMLASHILLAAVVPFLALISMIRGLSRRYDKHRRIARWTLPIWLYVSVTGVLVYFMLYQWFPAPHVALNR